MSTADQLGAFEHTHSPLVPDLRVRVVTPNLDANLLALVHAQRRLDREVHREPTVHAGGVLGRIDTVEDILVELCCEVASKAVKLSLAILDDKSFAVVAAKALVATLR